jgi:dipeptidase D
MSKVKLEPAAVFSCFAQINRIPRPSKHEEKMIEFLKAYGASLGLEAEVDETGNVVIRKPATKGYENRETTIVQSHMDMVCEKDNGVDFDFMNDAIQTEIDGEWLTAKGTTLGADDGIGVAMELALLQDDTVEHGPIECVFTRDEETQLTGASGMKPGFMHGRYLLNLDSEDEGEIFISCAGGASTIAKFHFETESAPQNYFFFKVGIKGLTGGHSGDDIEKKRANANKLLVRFLYNEMKRCDLRIADIQSGGLHNAIPREGWAVCCVPFSEKENVRIAANVYASEIEEEFSVTEKTLSFYLESTEAADDVIAKEDARRMVLSLQAVDNGIYAMSQEIDWLVETSSNLASIRRRGNVVEVVTSQRSNIGSARRNMSAAVSAAFELAGAEVYTTDGYPGWKLNLDSELLKITVDSYRRLFKKEPKVLAIHAGLECGLFSEKYPEIDMVSFGPTLRGVHSPDEKLLIPTVKMVWDFLLDILKNIPAKK